MPIGRIAACLGVSPRTLTNYERAGKIRPARRNPLNGRRIYSQEDLEALVRLLGGNAAE